MSDLSAFDKPQKLINRAEAAWTDAHSAFKGFTTLENLAMVTEKDPHTGENVQKIVQINPLPDTIEGRITDAINNTRNSFDQIIFAACYAIGRPIKDGHYPWATSPSDLDNWRLKNGKTGKEIIPSEFWETIREHQPYPSSDAYVGGHTHLRAVATLANRKHTVGIEIGCNVASMGTAIKTSPGFHTFSALMPRWDPVKKEIEVLRWRDGNPELLHNTNAAFYICFDETAPIPLPKFDVLIAVDGFIQYAQHVLDTLRTRASALI